MLSATLSFTQINIQFSLKCLKLLCHPFLSGVCLPRNIFLSSALQWFSVYLLVKHRVKNNLQPIKCLLLLSIECKGEEILCLHSDTSSQVSLYTICMMQKQVGTNTSSPQLDKPCCAYVQNPALAPMNSCGVSMSPKSRIQFLPLQSDKYLIPHDLGLKARRWV